MQVKRILGLALVLSLVFVLAACNAGAATPAPTAEATTASDSGDSGDSGSADLSESASAAIPTGGTLNVNYPSGWTATEVAGSITLTSSDASQIVNVAYYDTAMGADAAAVMETLKTGFAATGTAGDVTEMELGGKPAVSLTVTTTAAGTEVTTTYYLVTLETGYALVSGAADAATMEAIAGSASYSS